MEKLLAFLDQLENEKIWYLLTHVRETVMVITAVPGELWEVEFFANGNVEVERYISTGNLEDESALARLFANYRFSEPEG